MKLPITLLLLAFSTAVAAGQVTLVATGSVWKYLHNGADEGTAWRTNSFNDSLWPVGAAQFGWGDGDEQTLLVQGPPDEEVPITIFFRKAFLVTNTIYTVTLRLLRDDGAIVYINGREVLRDNLPSGPVDFQTFAREPIQTNENRYVQYGLFSDVLRQGSNMIAVEVHQAFGTAGWEDGSFDLELTANNPQGPPRVNISLPANGAIVPGGNVPIPVAADVSDEDGHVTFVQFFLDQQLVSAVNDPPFQATIFAGAGRHMLRARATDNFGQSQTSPPFYFQVGADLPVNLIRAPYLQSMSPTGLVVRWRTDWPTNSVLRFGTNSANLDTLITLALRTNEHQVILGGLAPDTLYYYDVGTSAQTFGGGPFSFRSAPTNSRAVRVWVVGDAGTGQPPQEEVRDAYYNDEHGGIAGTDLWLMLGDNAYESGTDDEYQAAVFEIYRDLLSRAPVWPTLGNHDTGSPGFPGQFPYLDMFTLPTKGECGGVPSGTEKYYSFDYANIHFICLDSETSDSGEQSPMMNWLREDLGATDKDWIVAFFHRPPYSFGSHHSDMDPSLVQIRERILPVLEANGVDLVLSGHSHVYERSFLLNGHYGYSWTLRPEMMLDAGLGRTNSSAYPKPWGGLGANRGTVYAVVGCSGQANFLDSFELHPAMATNSAGYGSMILDFDGLKLNARFLRSSGIVADYFTIDKSLPTTVRPQLKVARSIGAVAISWPTANPTYDLETAMTVDTNTAWHPTPSGVTTVARRQVVSVPVQPTNQFFRLRSR